MLNVSNENLRDNQNLTEDNPNENIFKKGSRKIARAPHLNPNSNTNAKPNPNPDRDQFSSGAVFLAPSTSNRWMCSIKKVFINISQNS